MLATKNPLRSKGRTARGAFRSILFALRSACLLCASVAPAQSAPENCAFAIESTAHCRDRGLREASDDDAVAATRRNGEADSNILQLLLSWQACFTKEEPTDQNVDAIVAACDRAATFSNLRPKERARLEYRRAKILRASGKEPSPEAGKVGPEGR